MKNNRNIYELNSKPRFLCRLKKKLLDLTNLFVRLRNIHALEMINDC